MIRKSKQILILLVVLLSSTIYAKEKLLWDLKGVALGVGTLSPPTNLFQVNEQGDKNGLQFNFLLKIDSFHYLSERFMLSFSAAAELPKSDEVENKRYPFFFTARLHYQSSSWCHFYLGNMLYFQNQFGSGESVTMPNGNSTTEFYLPEQNHSARNWIVELGADLFYDHEVFFQPAILLINITNTKKQAIGYLLTLNYYFDSHIWTD